MESFIESSRKNGYFNPTAGGYMLTPKGMSFVAQYQNEPNSYLGRYLEEGVSWVMARDPSDEETGSSVPASDRYVTFLDNQRSEVAVELAEFAEHVRSVNDASEIDRQIALSEIAAFEATIGQPRVSVELIERFTRRIIAWIVKTFGEALLAATAAALITKLLPLVA